MVIHLCYHYMYKTRSWHTYSYAPGFVYKTGCDNVEFAYNRATHSSTKMCPFQIVYGYIPRAPIDLLSFDPLDAPHVDDVARAQHMLDIHAQTQQNIAHTNAKN